MVDLAVWFAIDAIAWLVQKPARLVLALVFGGLGAVVCTALFVG
jgi:hypothetical protein